MASDFTAALDAAASAARGAKRARPEDEGGPAPHTAAPSLRAQQPQAAQHAQQAYATPGVYHQYPAQGGHMMGGYPQQQYTPQAYGAQAGHYQAQPQHPQQQMYARQQQPHPGAYGGGAGAGRGEGMGPTAGYGGGGGRGAWGGGGGGGGGGAPPAHSYAARLAYGSGPKNDSRRGGDMQPHSGRGGGDGHRKHEVP